MVKDRAYLEILWHLSFNLIKTGKTYKGEN